ncbi:proline-rich receptor-like protein kinase PERK2 [Helianthus annuus]|uniref:proline-rich receptor-like protein kinase PERK2 n=1 Tax=Helianthus annuus TaxID=4232 RepID=UPI000B8F0A09|nr:proline-rich receptor-like protein kinase PERK2 [Helianthus annuus]
MENSSNLEKQPETSTEQTQFTPTPTQPSPNTFIPSEQQPQTTQAASPLPSIPPPPFPDLDNMPPLTTQPISFQYPTYTQTSSIQHSSPYVRIVDDQSTVLPNQAQPVNSSTSIYLPTQPSHYQPAQHQRFSFRPSILEQGNSPRDFGDDYDEYDNYGNQAERQGMQLGNYKGNMGSRVLEQGNQNVLGYQTVLQQQQVPYQQP